MTDIRIVLAEDNLLVREGLVSLISTIPDLQVVGTSASLPELLEAVERHEPDIVMTDIRMPPTHQDEGIRAAATLRDTHPEIGVVVLSQFVDPAYALALLEAGSNGRGYVLQDNVDDVERLDMAILEVVADELCVLVGGLLVLRIGVRKQAPGVGISPSTSASFGS